MAIACNVYMLEGDETHPASGKVVLDSADFEALSCEHVIAALERDMAAFFTPGYEPVALEITHGDMVVTTKNGGQWLIRKPNFID